MKSSPSVHMSRLLALVVGLFLLCGGLLCGSAAQNSGLRSNRSVPPPVRRLEKPLSKYDISNLPLQRISQEQFDGWQQQVVRAAEQRTAAPAPPATTPQFVDLTTNPRPPFVGPSTLAQEVHPNWSWDQRSIYFASNNVDSDANYGATAPPAGAKFHVYRMTSDGNVVTRITGVGANQIPNEATGEQVFPAINFAQTKLAFVHRDTAADPGQLYILDLLSLQRTKLTGVAVPTSPLNADLTRIEHPSWEPGDASIAFAAIRKSVSGDVFNIYRLDVVSRVVTQLTFGGPAGRPGGNPGPNGVEFKDPIFYPNVGDGRIAFAANSASAANGALNYGAPTAGTDHNLFIMNGNGTNVRQITTQPSDDLEPSFNRTVDALGNPRAGSFNGFLAFSSKGRAFGGFTATTYDIYFYDFPTADVAPDLQAPAENGTTRVPIRLFTPDTNAGAVPLNQTDERYPTWSAGQPPQNPIDRIAFQSNRKNNTADLGHPLVGPAGDTDIWTSEVTDITPPTLFMFDENKGEVLHIANQPLPTDPNAVDPGRRLGAPGETFYFYAKLADLQYGIESVWLQIKDPDDASTDAISANHKLYGVGSFPVAGIGGSFNNTYLARTNSTPASTHFIHLPFETDYEGIGVKDYTYYNSTSLNSEGNVAVVTTPVNKRGVRIDQAASSRAFYASYNPGVDDSVRWSGNLNRPPFDANGNPRWLRLQDDGRFPDQVADDGVFSAQWVTPNDPSDFYVDLIAYDKAFNPRNTSQVGNWIIYDNIWGFSTQSYTASNPVMFVDDNGAGQKWPRGLKGSFRPFPTFRYGTESEIIDRPEQFLPREVRAPTDANGNVIGPADLVDFTANAGVFVAGKSHQVYHFLDGNAVAYDFISTVRGNPGQVRAYRADLWRILAKGPLPETVLNNYVPTEETQPRQDPATGNFTNVQQQIPRRAVLWNSPYTGDIFLGAGSILDQATHALLTNYRNRHGRLVLDGGDILWALTGDNPNTQHPFMQDVFGANYVRDDVGRGFSSPSWHAFSGGTIPTQITQDVFGTFATNPVPNPPYWTDPYDPEVLGAADIYFGFVGGTRDRTQGNNEFTSVNDGTPYQVHDQLAATNGSELVYNDVMVVKNDTATQSKTVFMSFSLSAMGRRWTAASDTVPLDCLNYRAKVSHSMFCWMFSADLVGQVRNINGGAPISGAYVEASQGGQVVGAAFTQADGTYAIRGLPVGGWSLRAVAPGFLSFFKSTSDSAHGLSQSQEDFFLTPASPGSISGKVTDQFNNPVPGVHILATIKASPLYTGAREFRTQTAQDGTYVLPSLPVAQYDVTIEDPLPAGFGFPNNTRPTVTVTVNQAQNTPNVDFKLVALPGPLLVRVFELDANNTRARRSVGAQVTLFDANGQVAAGTTTQVTDANGETQFTNVPAGPIRVSVFKFGFQGGIANVFIPQQNVVEVDLAIATPARLFGRVIRAIDNQLVDPAQEAAAGRTLTKLELQLRGAPTKVLDTDIVTPFAGPPPNTGTLYNYVFSAQNGQYTVAYPGDAHWLPASVNADITGDPSFAPNLLLQGKDGRLSGRVVENLGGGTTPVSGAIVEVYQGAATTPITKVNTGTDGTFQTGTLKSDNYRVIVRKPGYNTNSSTPPVFLAGDTAITPDIVLSRTQRGQVFGLVRRGLDPQRQPVSGQTIQFFTLASSEFGRVLVATTTSGAVGSAPDGGQMNYQIGSTDINQPNLPAGTYEVDVPATTQFQAFVGQVTVPAQGSTRFDIDLQPKPGAVDGFVKDATTGLPIAGATVVITGATSVTLSTDVNGHYQTPGSLQGGTYTVTVSAFGFVTATATIYVAGPTTVPDILLQPVPPSHIRGTVTSSLDGSLISGVTIELLPAGGGAVIQSTTSTATTTGNPPANYDLFPVRPGDYLVRARRAGWISPAPIAVHVDPGVNVNNVNFVLTPEHVWGAGLHMISIPYNVNGTDIATILGPTFVASAYWLTDQSRYAIYPEPEAATIKPGKALFVRLSAPTPFTFGGTPVPDVPFSVPVKTGWNMIGSPRRVRIDWLRVKVATGDGRTLSMQQAMDGGIIMNGLFRFADGYFRTDFLDPFEGYWTRAFQDCTLIFPVNNQVSLDTGSPQKLASVPARSTAGLAAEIAALGLGPAPAGRALNQATNTQTINSIEHWPWRRWKSEG